MEIALFTFTCHTGVWDQPVSCLRLAYQSPGGLLCVPSYCSLALIAVDMLVVGIDPQADLL